MHSHSPHLADLVSHAASVGWQVDTKCSIWLRSGKLYFVEAGLFLNMIWEHVAGPPTLNWPVPSCGGK